MRNIFLSVLFWLWAIGCSAGYWSVSAFGGGQYHLGDDVFRPVVTVGLHRETDDRFSMSMYGSVTASTEIDNVPRAAVVSVTPALTTRLWNGRSWLVSMDLGIGVGHTFSNGATDHSHHTYLFAIQIEKYIRPNVTLYFYPALFGRTWQEHIGLNWDYMRVGLCVGYRFML